MRKFYSFGLVMLLSLMLCGIATVAQTVTVDNIVYEIRNDGTAQLQNGKSATGDVVIPAEVEYDGKKYSVYKINSDAFENNGAITSVEMPASLKRIDRFAFEGCRSLASITGGAETLDWIGQRPFWQTPWLANLPAEDGLKYWKGWIVDVSQSNEFDELHIKEGTIGKILDFEYLQGKTLYLPKSFCEFKKDEIRVERFVVDKEHPKWFSDDYGAIYEKNCDVSYYSYNKNTYLDATGQSLYLAPTRKSGGTLMVAEGTVVLVEGSCMNGKFDRIIVPEGCEYVLDNSLRQLSICKYIELPSTLKYFCMFAPDGDSQLEIVLKAKEVPDTDLDPFAFCKHVTLYVPKESLEKYQADTRYNGKFKEIKAIPDNVTLKGDVNSDGKVNAADVTTVYNYIANPEATGLTLDKVDINGDGNVNATDITDLYNLIQME